MATVCRFVDAISSSPNVRFDFVDPSSGVSLQREGTEFPPPPLARSLSANFMRDGGQVGPSVYGMRSVRLRAHVDAPGDPDGAASVLQSIYREVDRADNLLMWQPDGMSKPVFFRTFRSGPEGLDTRFSTALGLWVVQLNLLAEPFALGLREELGPFTVNNDPAAGSNGCFVDVTGVIGDVAAPAVIENTTAWRTSGLIASRLHGTPSDMVRFKQAEDCTLGTDTTNPGGGPDAAMSGTGTNNYVRTSFATNDAMAVRVSWSLSDDITTGAESSAMRGAFRVLAAYRRSATTSALTARVRIAWGGGQDYFTDIVALPSTGSRAVMDLGVVDFAPVPERFPYDPLVASATAVEWPQLQIWAARDGGTDTLDWDCIMLVPADEQTLAWRIDEVQDTGLDMLVDGVQDDVYSISGDPFSGGTVGISRQRPAVSGGFPVLVPNQTNRLFVFMGASGFLSPVTDTNALTLHYWPRYLHVRPSAT